MSSLPPSLADATTLNGERTIPSNLEQHFDLKAMEKNTKEEELSHWNEGVKPLTLPREILFVTVVCCGQLFTQAALGQVVIPLHIIGQSLGIDNNPGELSWTVAAYSLTVGIFVCCSGRLGDIYGHRLLFIIGFAWFGLWSLVLGFTVYCDGSCKANIFFDVCRALQGIGPATILPNAVALLGSTYKNGSARKNFAFAWFAATAPSGFVIGGAFAGIFSQLAWWPWNFWSLAIACFVVVGISFFVVPEDPPRPLHLPPQNRTFDFLGTVSALSGLILFNFAWNQAAVVGWTKPYTYILLIVGVLLIITFFWIETKVQAPLVPKNVWNRTTIMMLGCIACGWASFGIWNFYMTQFLQLLRNATPLTSVAFFIPAAISGFVASGTTAILIPKIGPPIVMVTAMLGFCVAQILFSTAPIGQTYWAQTFVSMMVAPFGMDQSFPAATIVMSNAVPQHEQGIAASLVNTVLNFSISIGLGIAGTVESQVNPNGDKLLTGYRSAAYLGIGLSGLGIFLSLINVALGPSKHKDELVQSVEKEMAASTVGKRAGTSDRTLAISHE